MEGGALFEASVPVFLRYLARIDALAEKVPTPLLHRRLTPDGFSAIEHLNIAQGFALRATLPLVGRAVPDLEMAVSDAEALAARSEAVRAHLTTLSPADFEGAETREITHRAGDAELVQPATEFLTCYGLPNFFFHLSTAYATLRQCGAVIGKADFDGFHQYPTGFSFQTEEPVA